MPTQTTQTKTRATRAKIIKHSVYEGGPELITVQATCRRFVLAELNTHRVLSKNSASSRAIPFAKQVQRIIDDLAYPVAFPAEQRGMQGGDQIEELAEAAYLWMKASEQAVDYARALADLGVHKSVVNRILEPFMWHTVVMTGTAWENFFNQRCSPLAQPEIRVMAEDIQMAVENSEPQVLREYQWHLPYVELEDWLHLTRHLGEDAPAAERQAEMVKISAARCARVSYLTQEGKRDVAKDIELYDRLVGAEPPHWSPLEHVATPWAANRQDYDMGFGFQGLDGKVHTPATEHLPRVGNLLGWRSLRTEVEASRELATYR